MSHDDWYLNLIYNKFKVLTGITPIGIMPKIQIKHT